MEDTGRVLETEVETPMENPRDEAIIIADQDQTISGDTKIHDEHLGQASRVSHSLEIEPPEFMRGEVDVKEQMDRTTRAMERVLRGGDPDGIGADLDEELRGLGLEH